MYDCSKEVLGFHDDEVTLPQDDRTEMRNRRDTNRERLESGLKENDDPTPTEKKSQGSYSMKTMVQQPDNDYDIDDGVYFEKDDLKGDKGGDMTALDARKMILNAVSDDRFNSPPELKKNCVRIPFKAGYHIDVPVYRHFVENDGLKEIDIYELASSEWKRSDARDVTAWFDDNNQQLSPDEENGRQLRRVTRMLKFFAKSRPSWKDGILSGFGITKLVVDNYCGNKDREDKALRDTMVAIRDCLNQSLVINHPVTNGETITEGTDDSKAKFFREKITSALEDLEPLNKDDSSHETALKCWDKVFNTDYFQNQKNDSKNVAAVMTPEFIKQRKGPDQPVEKEKGGRYA